MAGFVARCFIRHFLGCKMGRGGCSCLSITLLSAWRWSLLSWRWRRPGPRLDKTRISRISLFTRLPFFHLSTTPRLQLSCISFPCIVNPGRQSATRFPSSQLRHHLYNSVVQGRYQDGPRSTLSRTKAESPVYYLRRHQTAVGVKGT
jgi:hypothetical protein